MNAEQITAGVEPQTPIVKDASQSQPTPFLNLFVNGSGFQSVRLSDLNAEYYIDTSGSTMGAILQDEKASAEQMMKVVKESHIVAWNNEAIKVTSLNQMHSDGGTYPSSFVDLIGADNKCFIVYTDGQIDETSMLDFKTRMGGKVNGVPVIIVFAVSIFSITIQLMQSAINMSIPEAFLSLSNDVVIVVTAKGEHRVLMTKGCFNILPSIIDLKESTMLTELPSFDLEKLKEISVTAVPRNLVRMKNVEYFVDLNALYALEDLPVEVLEGLTDRALIPRLELSRLQTSLIQMNRKLSESPELDAIRKQLYEIAASGKAGSDEHKQLVDKYNQMKHCKRAKGDTAKLAAINKILECIAEYQSNATTIVFGSNRATRAGQFASSALDELGTCVQIECPILMTHEDACILLKMPKEENYIEKFTCDFAINAPFELGTWLTPLLSPGIYGFEIASTLKANPYTREPVLGFLPLSEEPRVVMMHMSKLFGGNRSMWHFLRAFVSLLVHACDKEWVDQKLLIPYVTRLCAKCRATPDLKTGVESEESLVPLRTAFERVLGNHTVYLRDRSFGDVKAIIRIAKAVFPDVHFEEAKVTGMITVIAEFGRLLAAHKKNERMIAYVMQRDDYEHYVSSVGGVRGLIAHILWRDGGGEYRQLKVQMAVDKALQDTEFGPLLKRAFNGEAFDESALECSMPEPGDDPHFDIEEKYGTWTNRGKPDLQCTQCGQTFATVKEKLAHLREKLGEYFFNGHAAARRAVRECGKDASDKEIFLNAKARLYKKHGERAKVLHTRLCRERLLAFIARFKSLQQ